MKIYTPEGPTIGNLQGSALSAWEAISNTAQPLPRLPTRLGGGVVLAQRNPALRKPGALVYALAANGKILRQLTEDEVAMLGLRVALVALR